MSKHFQIFSWTVNWALSKALSFTARRTDDPLQFTCIIIDLSLGLVLFLDYWKNFRSIIHVQRSTEDFNWDSKILITEV